MRVPNKFCDCVAFLLTAKRQRRTNRYNLALAGTAFFLFYEDREAMFSGFSTYLVTARHVVQKLKGERWAMRINLRDGTASTIVRRGATTHWYPHPDRSVDLAVLPISLPERHDFKIEQVHWLDCFREPEEEWRREYQAIGVGDEVFYPALFGFMEGKKRNLPIMRMGNIAMMPPEPIPLGGDRSMHGYLIEARSIGGMSGAPVFVRTTVQTERSRGDDAYATTRPLGLSERISLLGVMRGHWEIPPKQRNEPVPIAVQSGGVNRQEHRRRGMAVED